MTPSDFGFDTTAAAILLVDDRPENLVALEAVLEPLGHDLRRATSGEEALKHRDHPGGRQDQGRLHRGDEVVLVQLAQLAAVAIENAERYEEEHRIAETLQRSLLPAALPDVAGLSLDPAYRPGSTATLVGGDWYDVFVLGDHRVGLAVGDVVGRGTRAAALMGQLRTAMRAYAVHGLGPAALMASLDRLLQDVSPSSMATAVYVELDLERRVLEAVSAGHPPVLLAPPSGPPCYLDLDANVPLGVLDSPTYQSSKVELEPASLLIFFTDGLVESVGLALQDGLDRLLAVVASLTAAGGGGGGSVDGLCERIIAATVRDPGQDDIALLAVRTS